MRGFRGIVEGAAAGVAVLVLLTGCAADEPAPQPAPSTATTPSPSSATSSPPVAVPQLPEAATVGDAAGAEAFVRHWVDVLNYAYETGDTGPLDAITGSACDLCAQAADSIEATYSTGGHIEGAVTSLVSIASPPPDDDGLVAVSVRYGQAASVDVDASGGRTAVDAVPEQNAGFILEWADGSWQLVGIGSE